ncbi:ribosomal RNA-processing protein 8 [Ischnura elegans]|uniref:ribosomal RNA-processing protein 8 n=1 Tax=Ischnura elegans TaxID=197161 RepID=UPI001ED8AC53|nr:ribosomal RNA-processing protein 8 [Ischnura elegans]
MEFFETPSWDGDIGADNLSHDLFRPHIVSRAKVPKKRKRNKYPRSSEGHELSNSVDCPAEEPKVASMKKRKRSEKRRKSNNCDQGLASKDKTDLQDEPKIRNEKTLQSRNSDSPVNKPPPDSNRVDNDCQLSVVCPTLTSTSPSSLTKRKKKKKNNKVSNDDKNKLKLEHNLKKMKDKLNLSLKTSSSESKINDKLFSEDKGQKQVKSKHAVITEVNGHTSDIVTNQKRKLAKQNQDVIHDNRTKKKKKENRTKAEGKILIEEMGGNHSPRISKKISDNFTLTKEADGHARSPLPLLKSSHKTKKIKKEKKDSSNDSAKNDSETSKGSSCQLPTLPQSTKSKKRKHAVNCETGFKKKKITEEGDFSVENLSNKSKKLQTQCTDMELHQTMEPDDEGGSNISHGLRDKGTSGGSKKKLNLRDKMMEKLRGSRFRFMNEQMYNAKSEETRKFFMSDQKSFKAYHEGYKQQLVQWPIKPVDAVIKYLKKKPTSYVIADFGCGDALIAQSLPNLVHSFDYVALNDNVTACDMAHTPLSTSSVDVAVFCLSLMGSNLSDYIREANRVLKVGGILKIAEVESRFDNVEKFIRVICKYGFLCIGRDLSKDVFYIFDFKKEKNIKDEKTLPPIMLRACSYKKR